MTKKNKGIELIKSCPFCGSDDVKMEVFFIECRNCHATGPFIRVDYDESAEDNRKRVIDAWNNRPIEDDLRSKLIKMTWQTASEHIPHGGSPQRWNPDGPENS